MTLYSNEELDNISAYLSAWPNRVNTYVQNRVAEFMSTNPIDSVTALNIMPKFNAFTTNDAFLKDTNGVIKKEVSLIVKALYDNSVKPHTDTTKDRNLKSPLDFYCDIMRLDVDNMIAFDAQHNLDKTKAYDIRDEEKLINSDNERMPIFDYKYQSTLNKASNVGFTSSNTLSVRSLKQHITNDPSIIDYMVYSINRKRDNEGNFITERTAENNIIKMFNIITCLKFWFDIYVEGMFYNLIYPGKYKPESAQALLKIKEELIKRINIESTEDKVNSGLLSELNTFESQINARHKALIKARKNLNTTEMLYGIISTNQSNNSKIENVAKKVYEHNDNHSTRLGQLSRFSIDQFQINEINEKIGKESKVDDALKFAKNQTLINKYMNGEQLSGEDNIKAENILKKLFVIDDIRTMRGENIANKKSEPISSASASASVTNEITESDVDSIINLFKTKDELKLIMNADNNIARALLNIWTNQIIGKNEIVEGDIGNFKQLLITATRDTIGQKLSGNKLILNILNASAAEKERKINEFIEILRRIKNEITNNLNKNELEIEIQNYNTQITNISSQQAQKGKKSSKKGSSPEEKIAAIKSKIKPYTIKYTPTIEQEQVQSQAVEYVPHTVNLQLTEEEKRKGAFALDKWQIEFINIIKNNKSCLLTTPTGVGKTITMLTCIHTLINEINAKKTYSLAYIAPSVQLALQNYANIKKTFTNLNVALITESFVYESSSSSNQSIYVGTPTALSNYFDAKDTSKTFFTVNCALFDEIHLILPTYARNVHDKIRIRETVKLLGRCKDQFIGASATIPNVDTLNEYIKEKCGEITDKTKFAPVLQFENVNPKPALPKLIEHVFTGENFVQFRRDENGDVINNQQLIEQITGSSHTVSVDNFFNFMKNTRTFNTPPALVFEHTEIHAFSTFQEIVNKFKENNTLNYPNKYKLSKNIRPLIVAYILKRKNEQADFSGLDKKNQVNAKKFYDEKNSAINKIFSEIRKTMIECLNDIIKPDLEKPEYVKRTKIDDVSKEIKDSMIDLLKSGILEEFTKSNIDTLYANINAQIELSDNQDVQKYYAFVRKIVEGKLTKEIKEIMEAYNKYNTELDYCTQFSEGTIKIRNQDIKYPSELEYHLTGAGNENKLIDNNKLLGKIIDNFNSINEFGKKMIEAENIDTTNDDIKTLYELYVDGAEYGVTCVIPTLPWFIQIEVISALRNSHIDRGFEVAFVFTSKDMSIGIDYPLNSVIIKAPNGTTLNNNETYFENILLIQMSGRCGRRSSSGGKDGMVYYYGVSNYSEANGKKINSLAIRQTKEELDAKIDKLSDVSFIRSVDIPTTNPSRTDKEKNLFIELYKLSLSGGTHSLAVKLQNLPVITNLNNINSWLSKYNKDTFKDIIKLNAEKEKVRFSLTIVIKPILMLEESYRSLTEEQQKEKLINVIEKIYKINEGTIRNEDITIDQINELNEIISKSLALVFEVYNKNRNIDLTKDRKDEIISCIKGLIAVLHSAEIGLLTFSNRLTTTSQNSSSRANSAITKSSESNENTFSLLSLLMSPFNLI